MTGWTWAAASCRGTSHERGGERRQDAFRVIAPGDHGFITMIACDGAGSATHGGVGARITAWTLGSCARSWLSATGRLPDLDGAACWMLLARARIFATAVRLRLDPRSFATTAVMAVSDGRSTLTAHVGDGAVVASPETGGWMSLSWPAQGEYAGTTCFMTDEGGLALRVFRHDVAVDRLAVMTDGLERLALDFRACVPHAAFLDPMLAPLVASAMRGCDRRLSAALRGYLDGPEVNERTDDDKTLVLASLA